MTEKNKKMLKEEECWEYYSTLPVYPLGDIRDYLSLLGFLFDMELEDGYSAELHKQVEENQFELKNHFLKENFTIHLELSAILFIMKIKL